jgi:hypothetical protein
MASRIKGTDSMALPVTLNEFPENYFLGFWLDKLVQRRYDASSFGFELQDDAPVAQLDRATDF